ncbi:hypothetical protein [Cytophaga aurantiaca]|uniref:hypothetical protein n=1 Tax=Cytophaga aurantiaca TaxID=29530 RepID=UPI000524C9E1|nr:hypothetical protein [Cytophaga aurantiaca]
MKSLYILLIAMAIAAVSCRTKDGAPGPAGENTLTQNGSVSGKVTFVDDSGKTVNSTFKYEYYETLTDNRFYILDQGADSDYEITLNRRAADDVNNYFNFSVAGFTDLTTGIENDPYSTTADFKFVTIANGTLYEFNETNTAITNLQLDPTTGRLTFNFTSDMNYSNGTATVSGTADVTVYRVYHSIIVE